MNMLIVTIILYTMIYVMGIYYLLRMKTALPRAHNLKEIILQELAILTILYIELLLLTLLITYFFG